jgi:hypothetical protein
MCLTGRKTQNAECVDTAARHGLCTEGNYGLINSATKKDVKYTYSEHQEKGKLLISYDLKRQYLKASCQVLTNSITVLVLTK